MKKKLSIAAILLLSALITMSACGDDSGDSKDSSTPAAPAVSTDVTESKDAVSEPKTTTDGDDSKDSGTSELPAVSTDVTESKDADPEPKTITESDIIGVYRIEMGPDSYEAMKKQMFASNESSTNIEDIFTEDEINEMMNEVIESTLDAYDVVIEAGGKMVFKASTERMKKAQMYVVEYSLNKQKEMGKDEALKKMSPENAEFLEKNLEQYSMTWEEYCDMALESYKSLAESTYTDEYFKKTFNAEEVENGMIILDTSDYEIKDNKILITTKNGEKAEMTYDGEYLHYTNFETKTETSNQNMLEMIKDVKLVKRT